MGTLPGDTILFSVKLIIMYVHFLSVYVLVKPDQITFCMNMTKKVGVNLFLCYRGIYWWIIILHGLYQWI